MFLAAMKESLGVRIWMIPVLMDPHHQILSIFSIISIFSADFPFILPNRLRSSILNSRRLYVHVALGVVNTIAKSTFLNLILIETLRTNHLGHRRSAEVITPETTVQKQQQSGVQPKRVRIFPGGYIDKSTEEYTYVRGRGRGRYVYEECGIRCKKPSMLKKCNIVTTLSARWLRV